MEYLVGYPVAFHTVDACIVKKTTNGMFPHSTLFGCTQILLVQKHKETSTGKWRFPGGFVDVTDDSAESAVAREAKEETGLDVEDPMYIGSIKIDDERYRNSPHKIITSFFEMRYVSGTVIDGERKDLDDVAKTKWFDIDVIKDSDINPIHLGLLNMVRERYKAEIEMEQLKRELLEENEKTMEDAKKLYEKFSKVSDSVVEEILAAAPEIKREVTSSFNRLSNLFEKTISNIFKK